MFKKFLLVIILLGLILTGCSEIKESTNNEIDNLENEGTSISNEKKDVLTIGLEHFNNIGNPLFLDNETNRYTSNLLFDGLISNDDSGKVIPKIAYKWELSEDKRTYIFYLNSGIQFHDGKELTSKDVEFTYYAISNVDYDGQEYNKVTDIKGIEKYKNGDSGKIEGINIIDKYTISFTINEIDSFKIYDFNVNILPTKTSASFNNSFSLLT